MGDDAASAEPTLLSLRRIRPHAGDELTSARRLRGRGISAATQSRFPTADLPVQANRKCRSRTSYEESTLLRSRHGHFRENVPERTKHLHDAPFRQSRHEYLSGGVDLAGGERTDRGGPSGPRATLAAWSRLFLRRSRPSIRQDNGLARNFWTQSYFGRVSSDCTWWYFPTREERRPGATK